MRLGTLQQGAAVLDDDFNTPAALAIFHRWAREGALAELRRGLAVFGLGELADRRSAGTKPFEDGTPRRVGEGCKRKVNGRFILNH